VLQEVCSAELHIPRCCVSSHDIAINDYLGPWSARVPHSIQRAQRLQNVTPDAV